MKSPETQTITVLTDARGGLATKTISKNPDGTFATEGFGLGNSFTWREERIASIGDLAEVIRGLAQTEFIIRGLIQKPLDRRGKLRLKVPRTGDTFFPHHNGEKKNRGATPRQWVMIDLDGKDDLPARFDLKKDGAEAIAWGVKEYLPDCFQNVTCFWQLSSSAGLKPGLRAHIWFWFDRAVTGGLLSDYLDSEGSSADPTVILNDVQPHFCVPPILDGCDDPIQVREGFLKGASDAVTLPDLNEREVKAKAIKLGRAGAVLQAAPGVESKLALLGDGEGLAGFNRVLTPAIMSAAVSAARAGEQLDREGLKARLRAALAAAPAGPDRGADIRRYSSDGYLDGSIRGAIEKAAAIVAEETAERPAFYPAVVGSLDEAEQKIAQAMEAFREDALQFQRDREAAVAALAAERVAKVATPTSFPAVPAGGPVGSRTDKVEDTISEQEARDREAVEDRARAAVPAVSGLLITPTASGKSTQARKAIAKMLEDHPGKCIGIASPRHALNDEQAADLRERLGSEYRVAVYRGRNAEDPDAPLESDEPDAKRLRMCVVNERIGELVGAGGAAEDLCRKGTQKKPGCPHWSSCGYIRQRETEADVWLFAHNVRTKKKPKPIGELAAVFVDESPVDVHLGGVDGTPVALTFGELQDVVDALARLRDGLMDDNPHKAGEADLERRTVEGLRDALMTGENGKVETAALPDLTGAGRLTWATCEKPTVAHAMSRSEFEAALALNGPYNATVRRVHRLFEIIKAAERNIVPGLTKTDTGVTMSWKVGVGDGFDVPTLYMDATARAEVYQALFPVITDDRITRVDVAAPHMAVTQVTDWNASRRKLVPSGAARGDTAANNAERLRDLIEVEAYRKRGQGTVIAGQRVDVLVITYKATAAALEAGRLPSNVDVAYLGNLTGLDRWRGVAGLILAGSGFIGVDDVERRAELLKGSPVDALESCFGDWYAKEIVGGRRRGSDFGPGLPRYFHSDRMAEAVRWSMVEGELIQAIGRGRGIRRAAADPLDVTILCNVPLPFEADFTTWREVLPQPCELMAARGVVLDTKPGARGFWTVVGSVLRTDGGKLRKAAAQAAADGSRSRLYVPPANDNRGPWCAPDAFWLRGRVKLGRYSVPIRFDPFGDLADAFDDRGCLVVSADQFPARRSAADILLRG